MKVFQCAIRMSKDKLNVYHHQQITPTERTWIEFSQHGLPVTQRTFNERLNNAPCAVLIGEKKTTQLSLASAMEVKAKELYNKCVYDI